MKKPIWNMIKILLVTIMIIMLPGTNNPVYADEIELKEGAVFKVGDTMKISSKTAWILHDDQLVLTSAKEMKGGSFTLPKITFSSTYWRTDDFFDGTDGYGWNLQFHFYSGNYSEKFTDYEYMATGVKCFHGDGSKDHPFQFSLILEKIPTADVTFELGEGHEDLAAKIYNSIPESRRTSYDGKTTILLKFPILDKNGETKKLIDMLSDLSDSAEDALPESGIDKDQFLLTVAPKPISDYSDRGELDEDVVANASKEELAADKSYTVHAIWFDLISEVDLTIDNPVAGTKITCTDNVYGSDQSPVPSVSVNSSHCGLMKISADGETMRDAVNYATRGEDPDFYPDVVMVEGEKYTVCASLEPDFAYYFDSQVKLMINGKDESSQIAKYFPDALSFYYDIEVVEATEDRYYVFAGDGSTWKKGSSSTADFTFKRTIEDESTFENFSGIRVDGKDVERTDKNYTAGSGSVVIKLQPAYLETLSVGEHTLTAVFADDMTAEAKFTVVQESSGGSSSETKPVYNIPKTGIE